MEPWAWAPAQSLSPAQEEVNVEDLPHTGGCGTAQGLGTRWAKRVPGQDLERPPVSLQEEQQG